MMRAAAAIFAIAWLASGAVADPLAAPGECAQPNQEIVIEPELMRVEAPTVLLRPVPVIV